VSKKIKRDKSKPRKGRGRGAFNGSASELIASEAAPEGAPADQPVGISGSQDTPQAPKAPRMPKVPRTPARVNGVDKAQKEKHNAVINSRNDTVQLRAKAGAQERKMQGQRNGNR
jgi:hypothetical protein